MTLAFVTDNGFSQHEGAYYYTNANIQHILTARKFYEKIIFVARKNNFDNMKNKLSINDEVYLIENVKSLKGIFELNKTLKNVIKKSDVVICFGINGYFAYKIAKKMNKPVISYVGGSVFDILTSMRSLKKKIIAPFIHLMIKDQVKYSDYVHYVDSYLIKQYPTFGKTLICPSAIIEVKNKSSIIEYRKKLYSDISIRTIKFGIIGSVYNNIKGIDLAIKALSSLDINFELEIVGRGNHDWLNDIIEKENVKNKIKFLGTIEDREGLFKWLDSLDIYLQPSRTEGMPRATIEAMSRGLPVVSSNAGGLKNLINEKYIFNKGNWKEFADKIYLLIKSPSDLLYESRSNLEKAEKYDKKILDKKRNEFYNEIYNSLQK